MLILALAIGVAIGALVGYAYGRHQADRMPVSRYVQVDQQGYERWQAYRALDAMPVQLTEQIWVVDHMDTGEQSQMEN